MKRLYRLVINGWWPVGLDDAAAQQMQASGLRAFYEDCEIDPYDFDGLTLRLERATEADIAKYGEDEDEDD